MNPSILKGTFSLFDPFEKHKVTSDKTQGARGKPFLAPSHGTYVRVSERSTQGRVTRHTAIKAARFIETNLRNHNGQLLKSYRQGKGKQSDPRPLRLPELGMLELYQTTLEPNNLETAM